MKFKNFTIRLLQPNEGKAFFNLIENNRSRLEDFFAGTVSKTKTLEDMITDINTGEFIGLVDVKNINKDLPKAELGSFIDHRYEGKGVVTDATKLVVNHIVEEYKFIKLLCRANARNKGSIAVILKNGFELEGTIRRDYKTTKGEVVDLNYYGRVFN